MKQIQDGLYITHQGNCYLIKNNNSPDREFLEFLEEKLSEWRGSFEELLKQLEEDCNWTVYILPTYYLKNDWKF